MLDAAGRTHGKGMQSYLTMMAVRLLEMRRVLKDSGSIYLHCDPFASHYLKQLMDAVYGHQNFRNEVIWSYRNGGAGKRYWPRKHDVLLFYSKSDDYTFNVDAVRVARKMTHMRIEVDAEGKEWQVKRDNKTGKGYFYSIAKGAICPDFWNDIHPLNRSERERIGYPTQKPLAPAGAHHPGIQQPRRRSARSLLWLRYGMRSSRTNWARKWVGIDLSPKAVELVNERLRGYMGDLFHNRLVTARTDIPRRTDIDAPIPL